MSQNTYQSHEKKKTEKKRATLIENPLPQKQKYTLERLGVRLIANKTRPNQGFRAKSEAWKFSKLQHAASILYKKRLITRFNFG